MYVCMYIYIYLYIYIPILINVWCEATPKGLVNGMVYGIGFTTSLFFVGWMTSGHQALPFSEPQVMLREMAQQQKNWLDGYSLVLKAFGTNDMNDIIPLHTIIFLLICPINNPLLYPPYTHTHTHHLVRYIPFISRIYFQCLNYIPCLILYSIDNSIDIPCLSIYCTMFRNRYIIPW